MAFTVSLVYMLALRWFMSDFFGKGFAYLYLLLYGKADPMLNIAAKALYL